MPEVSIIMPAYNAARFLGEALQSVLGQTFQDFEIIVVDDGSTDDTARVVAGIVDQRIRYAYQENGGSASARNHGLRLATGSLIAFLDPDDLWEPGFLQRMVGHLGAHPDVDGVYCGYRYMQADGTPLPEIVRRVVPPETLYLVLLEGSFLNVCAVVIRRRSLDIAGWFDETLRCSEDYELWLRMTKNLRFEGLEDVLVWYRRHEGNKTLNLVEQVRCHALIVAKHFGEENGDPAHWPMEKRVAYGGYHRLCADNLLRLGDIEGCAASVARMLTIRPDWIDDAKWYSMLISSSVPPDRIGDVHALDLRQAAQQALAVLNRVFATAQPMVLVGNGARVYANMCWALAMVAYWQGRVWWSWSWFIRAIGSHPGIMLDLHRSYWMARYFAGGIARLMRRVMGCSGAVATREIPGD